MNKHVYIYIFIRIYIHLDFESQQLLISGILISKLFNEFGFTVYMGFAFLFIIIFIFNILKKFKIYFFYL